MHTLTLIPGDGIGPSIADAVKTVVAATGASVQWEEARAGLKAIESDGDPLPRETMESIQRNKVALKGPLTTPVGSGFRSVNVALRKELDLFVNLRPVRSFEGAPARYKDIDLVIIRENTEGLYIGQERYVDEERTAAEMVGRVSRAGSQRVVTFAYEYATSHKRKKVTTVHKANILKLTSGMFLEVAREVGARFPGIKSEDKIIDNMAMQLVLDPHQFDVIVTTNLFGDIISDLASGLVGGLGLAPGANLGQGVAIFEAVHGSAPDIAGKNVANPCAMILAAVMMMRHIGEKEAADRIERAVADVIRSGDEVTRDLNPRSPVGTREMADAIAREIERTRNPE